MSVAAFADEGRGAQELRLGFSSFSCFSHRGLVHPERLPLPGLVNLGRISWTFTPERLCTCLHHQTVEAVSMPSRTFRGFSDTPSLSQLLLLPTETRYDSGSYTHLPPSPPLDLFNDPLLVQKHIIWSPYIYIISRICSAVDFLKRKHMILF